MTIRIDETKRNIHEWLRAPDPSSNHVAARMKAHAGTGSWLVQNAEYAEWKSNAATFLWLNGIRRFHMQGRCYPIYTDLVLKRAVERPYYGIVKRPL